MARLFPLLGLIAADQLTKVLARMHLSSPLEIAPFFKFTLAYNKGIAFSLPAPALLVIVLGLVVVGYLTFCLIKHPLAPLERWAYWLVAAGASGNLIDRFLYGKVTDFIDLGFWPIFNLADSMVTTGVALFLLHEYKKSPPKR